MRERERVMPKPDKSEILKREIKKMRKERREARKKPRSKKQDPLFYEKTKQSQLVRDS